MSNTLFEETITIKNLRVEKPKEPWDFYIDRRSPVGNPYPLEKEKDRDRVIEDYIDYFNKMVSYNDVSFMGYLTTILKTYEVHGKVNLFCWCFPKRCHGDVIKRWIIRNGKYKCI